MNLPLMSPAALDNAVYELIARELGVANAMRFIARHNQPDGMDYTQDRKSWLPQDNDEIDRLFNEPNSEFESLIAEQKKKKTAPRRQTSARSSKKTSSRKKK